MILSAAYTREPWGWAFQSGVPCPQVIGEEQQDWTAEYQGMGAQTWIQDSHPNQSFPTTIMRLEYFPVCTRGTDVHLLLALCLKLSASLASHPHSRLRCSAGPACGHLYSQSCLEKPFYLKILLRSHLLHCFIFSSPYVIYLFIKLESMLLSTEMFISFTSFEDFLL